MKLIRILLVDDDATVAADLRRTLEKLDVLYKLDIAADGAEGLDKLNAKNNNVKNLPDLVLVDLDTPGMPGVEFIKTIRNSTEWKHLKCFALSHTNQKPSREKLKQLDISGCIIKPFRTSSFSSMDGFNFMIDLINMKAES